MTKYLKYFQTYREKFSTRYQIKTLQKEINILEKEVMLLKGTLLLGEYKSLNPSPLKVILGAGNIPFSGWIPSNLDQLDITNPQDWAKHFSVSSIDNLLAEHVLEHLTEEQIITALKLCFKYLKPGGVFRIAVPDGNNYDKDYLEHVCPPKLGHKILFTIELLASMLENVGFQVVPLEFFDSEKVFFQSPWDPKDGHIRRSAKFDKRAVKRDDSFLLSSLIVDAVKPE